MTWDIRQGHTLSLLQQMPEESVACIVTSPPYYGLRSYNCEPQVWGGIMGRSCSRGCTWRADGKSSQRIRNGEPGGLHEGRITDGLAETTLLNPEQGATCITCGSWRGELGSEPSVGLYIEHLMAVMAELWRVLRKDGTCWVNLGDSYAGGGQRGGGSPVDKRTDGRPTRNSDKVRGRIVEGAQPQGSLKPKDLCLVPERFAIAVQEAGWWVRSRIAWCKTSAMPESVTDRPTRSWEHIWMLSKSARYYYDADAVKTRNPNAHPSGNGFSGRQGTATYHASSGGVGTQEQWVPGEGANLRDHWIIGPEPFPGAHFAIFPTEISKRCILAGSRPGDTILDPFSGSGTTALVADRLGRHGIGLELNPDYAAMSRERIHNDAPMMAALQEVHP